MIWVVLGIGLFIYFAIGVLIAFAYGMSDSIPANQKSIWCFIFWPFFLLMGG